jgi:hypothetical protein
MVINFIQEKIFIQYYVSHCWKIATSTANGGGVKQKIIYFTLCPLHQSQNLVAVRERVASGSRNQVKKSWE